MSGKRKGVSIDLFFFLSFDLERDLTHPSLPHSFSLSVPPVSSSQRHNSRRPHHHVRPDDLEVPDPLHGLRVAGKSLSFCFLQKKRRQRNKNPTLRTVSLSSLSQQTFSGRRRPLRLHGARLPPRGHPVPLFCAKGPAAQLGRHRRVQHRGSR